MEIIISIIILFLVVFFIYKILMNKKKLNNKTIDAKSIIVRYKSKPIMTNSEQYFFNILNNNFNNKFYIIPQTNLASIIEKKKDFERQYQNELYRNIDFSFINKATLMPELLIEINDSSHKNSNRAKRDNKVKQICSEAKIRIITFYTSMPNKETYIIERINKELN